MKRYKNLIYLFFVLIVFLTACNNKKTNIKGENTLNNKNNASNPTVSNEKKEKSLEYQSAYNALLRYTEVVNKPEKYEDKQKEAVEFMYYTVPPVYDAYVCFNGLSYEEFVDEIITFAVNNGATEERMKEEMKKREGKIRELYDKEKKQVEEVVSLVGEKKEELSFQKIEFLEEADLNDDELKEINDNLNTLVEENEKKLEIFDININKYVTQKGYKAKFLIDGKEKEIKFYYMEGSWRIYIPEIFN